MAKSFFSIVLFLLIQASIFCEESYLVVLKGGGSAGKTSIGKALRATSTEWCVIDEDQLYEHTWLEMLKNELPSQYAAIEAAIAPQNRLRAIRNNEIAFLQCATEVQRQEAAAAVRNIQKEFKGELAATFKDRFYKKEFPESIVRSIQNGFEHHKYVLLDSWFFDLNTMGKDLKGVCAVRAFVFCSPFACYEHFKRRNQEAELAGDLSEKRIFQQLIPCWVKHYHLSFVPSERNLFQCQKSELEELFDRMRRDVIITRENPIKCELTLEKFDALRIELLANVAGEGTVFFELKEPYDIVLNTTTHSSKTIALTLLKLFEKGSFCGHRK